MKRLTAAVRLPERRLGNLRSTMKHAPTARQYGVAGVHSMQIAPLLVLDWINEHEA